MHRADLLEGAAREIGTNAPGLEKMTDTLYLPVARWLSAECTRTARRPFVLGISGPQGGGKSTVAAALVHAARKSGQRAVRASSDDFYLVRDAQVGLAERHPDNPYLQQRGYPGTHDVPLGLEVLEELRAGRDLELPRYDKSAHGGQGDRAPRDRFERVLGRQDLVVLEGWTLGFSAQGRPGLEPTMQTVDRLLAPYAAWNDCVDAWLLLRAEHLHDIVEWRVESERNRAQRGDTTMGEAGARRYIERCLPAYRVYAPPLWEKSPSGRTLRVVLRANRQPRSIDG